MKPQDIVFIGVFLLLLALRRYTWILWFGLGCVVLAIPLFATWTFFTAQRLTWYAAACFLIFTLISLFHTRRVQ